MSTLDVTKLKSKSSGTPTEFVDSGDVEVGQLCKAWVNFNGVGTVAIRDSFNVSSITDNGTGVYSVNFANAMNDANYSAVASLNYPSGGTDARVLPVSVSQLTIYTATAGSAVDPAVVCVAVFGS